jgi:hypothetical protein
MEYTSDDDEIESSIVTTKEGQFNGIGNGDSYSIDATSAST